MVLLRIWKTSQEQEQQEQEQEQGQGQQLINF